MSCRRPTPAPRPDSTGPGRVRETDETLAPVRLPEGPPLHLERPGSATQHLAPYLAPSRVARFRQVLARRTRHLTALLEGVHDPHNISACVRSCDAFGLQDLHLVTQRGDPVGMRRGVSKSTHRWLTVHYHPTTEAALGALRAAGYRVAATDLRGPTPPVPLDALDVSTPLCIAFGNERDGVSDVLRAGADLTMQIPMHGFVESLNISVAFAVSVHALRTRLDAARDVPGDLSAEAEADLIDRWVVADIPRGAAVLRELARRQGCPPTDSSPPREESS